MIQQGADLDQVKVLLIIIATLIAVVGYFLRKEIAIFGKRLDKHEEALFQMNGTLTKAVGSVEILFNLYGVERRKYAREERNSNGS